MSFAQGFSLSDSADFPRGVQTDLDLDSLAEDEIADAIPDLLSDYSAECRDWTVVAGEHWKQARWTRAEDVLQSGIRCKFQVRIL